MTTRRWLQLLVMFAMAWALRYDWQACHAHGFPGDVFLHSRQLAGSFSYVLGRPQGHSKIGGVDVSRSASFGDYDSFSTSDIPVGATVTATVVDVPTSIGPVLVAMNVASAERTYVSQTAADVVAGWNAGANSAFRMWAVLIVMLGAQAQLILAPKGRWI